MIDLPGDEYRADSHNGSGCCALEKWTSGKVGGQLKAVNTYVRYQRSKSVPELKLRGNRIIRMREIILAADHCDKHERAWQNFVLKADILRFRRGLGLIKADNLHYDDMLRAPLLTFEISHCSHLPRKSLRTLALMLNCSIACLSSRTSS